MSNGDPLDTFGNIAKATGGVPLNPLLVAGMQGAANVASDGVKKEAAKEAAAQPTPEVTIHGDGTATIKKLPVTDVLEKGALDAQKPIDDVEALIRERFAKAKAAGLVTEADNPYGADVTANTSGFGGGYRASRDLGAGPIHAAIQGLEVATGHFRTPEEIAAQVRNHRIQKLNSVYDTEAKPLLAEAQSQRNAANADRRLENADQRETRQQFDDYLKNVDPTGSEEDAVAGLHTRMGAQVQPGMEGMVRSTYRTRTRALAKQASDQGEAAIRGISKDTVLPTEDAEAYVKSLPLANDEQRARAMSRVQRAQAEGRQQDAQKRAALNVEIERNRQIAISNNLAARAQALQSPENIQQFVDRIKADPSAYYLPAIQDGKNKGFRDTIDLALAKEGLTPPNKLEKSDHDRLIASSQGMKDLDTIESIAQKWQQAGHPITGAALGRFNEKTANFGSTPIFALNGVPASQRAEYAKDLGILRSAITNVTLREVKANVGGRPPEKVIGMVKEVSPALFQDAPILAGATAGLRRELQNSQDSVLERAWGGTVPGKKGGDVKSLSNEDLFKRLMGH